MKRFKINYLLIGAVTVLLAVALWPSLPWFGQAENRIAAIQERGILRVSTIESPLTYTLFQGKKIGLDYELADLFANYLGVKLEVTIRPNIQDLFDDIDNNKADVIAAGLVYNTHRSQHYQAGPTYYSVSQQMVYRMGSPRPKSLADIKENQLVLSPGVTSLIALINFKRHKYPDLSWRVDEHLSSKELMQQVVEGKIAYTITDSVAISTFQRVHPKLAVALDVTDEQPVTWFSALDSDDSLSAALLDFYNRLNIDDTFAHLEEKYLGHVGDFDYVDTRSFLKAVDAVLPELQPLFEKYATEIDWRLLAAISYQESHWDNLATSPTGVRGLMMLTKNTAQSLGVTDRLDPVQSIEGGSRYLKDMMAKVPDSVPKDEQIWFALTAYNMGYAHMLDARQLTAKQKGNPDSWADVKMRLPLLSKKQYYSTTTYGYARGHEAYAYVENIRKYYISLVGYLLEKEKQEAQALKYAEAYPAVTPVELAIPGFGIFPLGLFSQGAGLEKNHLTLPSTLLPKPPQSQ
ncbi:MAG TPA: membrane-bound lytic murein transglycosylase MltF [Buttiauxella sp.]|nr:membrane-bound lytic murein transglycosylase MltF [Buttiauxella sp.]